MTTQDPRNTNTFQPPEGWSEEQQEWLDSLDAVVHAHGPEAARELLQSLRAHAERQGLPVLPEKLETPYRNTIPPEQQPAYPGDEDLEERIENLIRWNAMAMVLRANDAGTGVGGHIATYASAATMLEVGFNHVFRAPTQPSDDDDNDPGSDPGYGGDLVNIQAHASPGVYARAFLEGRLTETQLTNFRRELQPGGGLCSYPHPRRMPTFWQAPTASMGLSTVSAIYQARFARYLENRGLKPKNGGRVWNFIGDGEADEPEVLGTIAIAAREQLDNLVLCINCNLQRLDGPVRGNGKIIQELEGVFRGAGWNVVKVIWGSEWDSLLARDHNGVLQRRMEEVVDGDYQRYSTLTGPEVRAHWVEGARPEDREELAQIMQSLSDEAIRTIRRGGHDRKKIYAAYEEAMQSEGKPTVILLKTIKGYGLGERAEGQNTAHQKKKMGDEERIESGRRFGMPLTQEQMEEAEFVQPSRDSREVQYLKARREALGGPLPKRVVDCPKLETPDLDVFQMLVDGSGEREISTTMAMVRLLAKLMRDPDVGKYVVPIVPDEARTFGMDGLFRQAGIYSFEGQRYTPVDANTVLPYREAKDGQILQEGICEAGALASFIAAGTAYANYGVPTIPFYVFYSIFGFQRVGDLIWAAGDQLCKGFLLGGTAGRTTLNGEGLQHQDGHSQLVAQTVPSLMSYDPAFGYEVAVIVREGIRRMYGEGEDVFYYLTLYNENYVMPAMGDAVGNGHLLPDEHGRGGVLKRLEGAGFDVSVFGELDSGAVEEAEGESEEEVGGDAEDSDDEAPAGSDGDQELEESSDADAEDAADAEEAADDEVVEDEESLQIEIVAVGDEAVEKRVVVEDPEEDPDSEGAAEHRVDAAPPVRDEFGVLPFPSVERLATVEEGVLRGMYLYRESELPVRRSIGQVQLLASGSVMQQALEAQSILADNEVAAAVWSVTSYSQLYRDAVHADRVNRLQASGLKRPSYLDVVLSGVEGPFVAVSDYQRMLPDSIGRWFKGRFVALGTDGFGMSEARPDLRGWFEVSAEHVAYAALGALCAEGKVMAKRVRERGREWGILE